MPHRTPHQHQLLRVIGASLDNGAALQEQDASCAGVGAGQRRLLEIQLIPENPDADGHAGSPARRQALLATARA